MKIIEGKKYSTVKFDGYKAFAIVTLKMKKGIMSRNVKIYTTTRTMKMFTNHIKDNLLTDMYEFVELKYFSPRKSMESTDELIDDILI